MTDKKDKKKTRTTRTIRMGVHDTAIILTAENHGFRIVASEHSSQVARLGYRLANTLVEIACSDMAFNLAIAVLRGKVAGIVGVEAPDECDGDCENCTEHDDEDSPETDGPVDPATLPN